jgi:hypothetical protein
VQPPVESQVPYGEPVNEVALKQAFLQVSSIFPCNHLEQGQLSFYSDKTMDWTDEELWLNS